MEVVISTDSSNAIFTAPVQRILESVAYTVFDLAKYKWIHTTNGKLAEYFNGYCLDDFKAVIRCITLNQSGVVYTIQIDEDEVEEDYNIDEILKCSYDDFFSSLCDIISSYTRHGFSKDEENFLVVVGYFIQQVVLAVEVYQLRDVYEYYRALDCSENEFISMLPDDVKPLAVECIEYLKSEYANFNIATPSDMESLIDNMYACNQDIINILRECTK